jgi:hypothetical protein
MESAAEVQYVTDVERGYELYLANCQSCHGDNGQGGVGPPLNNQPKLYNALTADGQPGTGHLNPDYIDNVLTVGGRYVCGDPNSLMLAFKAGWLAPATARWKSSSPGSPPARTSPSSTSPPPTGRPTQRRWNPSW